MKLYVPLAALCAALAPTLSAQAQKVSAEASATPNAEAPTPRKTMLKLGTGLNRDFSYGYFSGLTLPIVLGVERKLTNAFSVYGNLVTSFQVTKRRSYFNNQKSPLIPRNGIAIGGRYYYNQAGRIKHRRAAGPFVGNYLALQTSTHLGRYTVLNSGNTVEKRSYYDYSAVSAMWGMQRQLGSLLLYDLNAGLAVVNYPRIRYDYTTNTLSASRPLSLTPEVNLCLSLAH